MLVIGIGGRAESGKSTAGRATHKQALAMGLTAKIFELSEYVLTEAVALGRIPAGKKRNELTDSEVEELVKLGMERRKEDPDYWTKKFEEDVLATKPDVVICPNIRFQNEADAVRRLGGYIVRVTCYISDGVEYVSRTRDPNHPSETSQHYILADYFLTFLRGESDLLKSQAACLLQYLVRKNAG